MQNLVKICKNAAKANIVPGIILQTFALSLVLGYYYVPAINTFFEQISEIKKQYGYTFSAISTGFFGGVLPFFILYKTKQIPKGFIKTQFFFYLLFWTYKGVEVDFFYRCQAWIFGNDNSFATVASKVAFDQFVYCPFFSMPISAVIYLWKDCDFSKLKFKQEFSKELFTVTTPALLVSAWVIWIPGTAIIYSLPSALQIPLFNIVLCFFVLILAFICKPEETSI